MKEGEVFKPDRLNELGIPTSMMTMSSTMNNSNGDVAAAEKPYRRASPLPPLQLIDFPDNSAVDVSNRHGGAAGAGAGGVDDTARQVSPVVDKMPHVAFLDQHEHADIEEVDEDQVLTRLKT